ncbi:hypothetical protein Verru16b_02539 [Lacunisphaera limnophila]|uniref:Uncharacterized protein n=2 Tax=Lacunisphaera limnophila TaxID=1838286 RepID=A0A1D8AX39_9BACT|nr:hypothetical protein Verru16b_02539 [Lacunisphaera limnophila]
MPDPSRKMKQLLRAHAKAPNHVSTARKLAEKADYKSWRGMNLQYGLLGNRVGKKLGLPVADLSVLADFIKRDKLANKEWLILMKPAFAKAVMQMPWF